LSFFTKNHGVATGDNLSNHLNDSAQDAAIVSQIKEICDLLKTRVSDAEEHSCADDKDEKMKHAWMLAAAVLDRISSIAFAVIFLGRTLVSAVSLYTVYP